MGAWIETYNLFNYPDASKSRPAWARGLKRDKNILQLADLVSRPAWARGLKLITFLTTQMPASRAPRGRVD